MSCRRSAQTKPRLLFKGRGNEVWINSIAFPFTIDNVTTTHNARKANALLGGRDFTVYSYRSLQGPANHWQRRRSRPVQLLRWNISDADLIDMTPVKARDLIVECFYQAQRETIAAAGRKLGQAQSSAELRDTVTGAVRLAFREATADFDHPTKSGLMAAVTILACKSQHWGTPPEIVEHHKAQIERVLQILN